ncbi:MAG: ABC transporter ATP-binding protein [Clostridiales bacterium]|nr:ABC transporter ATP-binding protein [Clostridiales bacterium]
MIELSGIYKRYGNIQALKDLSMVVRPGRALGLLGKNGAGKSTVMNILVGCLCQDAGTVKIDGVDMRKDPLKAKRAFGYLPENAPVYPEMTIREYLLFAARLNRVAANRQKDAVDAAMERLQLAELANRLTGALSKGQRQRVGLAQALFCTDARILVLDEPTSGLDPSQIAQFREMIKRMRGEYTILLSSHILADVRDVCDEIAVIDSGSMIVQGEMDALIDRYAAYTTLELVVEKDCAALLERLRGHGAVRSALPVGRTAEPYAKLCVQSDRDIRSDVFRAAVETGTVLLSMTAPESTLDNIFARITGSGREGT